MTRDHVKRLDRAAEVCGQTRQAFVQAAVLAEVAEVEERKRLKQLRVSRSSDNLPHQPQPEIDAAAPPTGTGIAEALRRQREADEPTQTPAQQSPVVVNVGGGGGSGTQAGDAIDRLAAFVVSGNEFGRDSRMRTALSVLRATATTDEERKVLAARLDEAIVTKAKSSDNGARKIARIAFDKLSNLLR